MASTGGLTGEESLEKHWHDHFRNFPELNTQDEYLEKAHEFIRNPPPGVMSFQRSNGEIIYYDEPTGIFVTESAEGLPATMFKPTEGRKVL